MINIKRAMAKLWISMIAGVGYCITSLAMNVGQDRTLAEGLFVTTGAILFLALLIGIFLGILWLTIQSIKAVKND